jgi:hypothetical protein
VVIVNHEGRGWWQIASKGYIIDLMQYLDRRLNFGQERRTLRRFVGIARPPRKLWRGNAKTKPNVSDRRALDPAAPAASRLTCLAFSPVHPGYPPNWPKPPR